MSWTAKITKHSFYCQHVKHCKVRNFTTPQTCKTCSYQALSKSTVRPSYISILQYLCVNLIKKIVDSQNIQSVIVKWNVVYILYSNKRTLFNNKICRNSNFLNRIAALFLSSLSVQTSRVEKFTRIDIYGT